MMHDGRIIYDVSGKEKKELTVDDLFLLKFAEASGGEFANDRMMLGKIRHVSKFKKFSYFGPWI